MNVVKYTKDIVNSKKELWFKDIESGRDCYVCSFRSDNKEINNTIKTLELNHFNYFDINAPTHNPLTLLSLISDKQSIQSINVFWDSENEHRGYLFGYSAEYQYGFYYVIYNYRLFSLIVNIVKLIKRKRWEDAYNLSNLYEKLYSRASA